MTLLVGSLCVLKSGSPIMTVTATEQKSMSKCEALQEIQCMWFDGGESHYCSIPIACLEQVAIG